MDKKNVQLVAVSKTRTELEIMKLYEAGQRDFGENRVQELLSKKDNLPEDIRWHLIGHLQSNKAKYITSFVFLIHSVDSLDLYKTLYKEALKSERKISVLLQFHIAKEESKYGLNWNEAVELVEYHLQQSNNKVIITGVMGMATLTNDMGQVRREFATLNTYFQQLKKSYFNDEDSFCEISMGMSGDYKLAVEEGATMVRIGSLLF
ncbi:MAG: YggS family pyridoxal phosphate-dependent enzyme [Saprospiraceae bacterium]